MYSAKHSFFCDNIDALYLSEEESNHAVRVLRLKENQKIIVLDGKGRISNAIITVANKKKLHFKILQNTISEAQNVFTHIAIAPTKSIDRFSFFIEKAIEIGIGRITPLHTKNSERKHLNIEKVRKNAISALKQSGNLFLPVIDEMQSFDHFLANFQSDGQCFIAHCITDSSKKELKNQLNGGKNVLILIGPEGDFTSEEIKLAFENNFNPVSLGKNRLRTETAGIVACHTVALIS